MTEIDPDLRVITDTGLGPGLRVTDQGPDLHISTDTGVGPGLHVDTDTELGLGLRISTDTGAGLDLRVTAGLGLGLHFTSQDQYRQSTTAIINALARRVLILIFVTFAKLGL